MGELINECRAREVELKRQAERGEKRKREEFKSGFKKPNVQSPQKKPYAKAGPQHCRNCGKVHAGECRKGLSICYKCGKAGHVASQCTSELTVCFNCYKTGHKRSECPDLREERKGKQQEVPKPKGRAFQVTAAEAKSLPDAVTGTFLINSLPALVLFDSGATCSFISSRFVNHPSFVSMRMTSPLEVEVANDRSFLVFEIFRDCVLEINGERFMIDLIPMPMGEIHVIVGMDWLAKYKANIMCEYKII